MSSSNHEHLNVIPKNWLITGGCGFIGLRLVKYLLNKSDLNIRILDNLSVGTQEELAKVCKYQEILAKSRFHAKIFDSSIQLVIGIF